MSEARLLSEDEITEARPARRRTTKTAAPAAVAAGEDLAATAETQPARPRVRKAKTTAAAETTATGVATADPAGEPGSGRSAAVAPQPVDAAAAPTQGELPLALSPNGAPEPTPVEATGVAGTDHAAPPAKPRPARSRATTRKSTAAKAPTGVEQSATTMEAAPAQPADLPGAAPVPAAEAPTTAGPQTVAALPTATPGGEQATAQRSETAAITLLVDRAAIADRVSTTQQSQSDRVDSPADAGSQAMMPEAAVSERATQIDAGGASTPSAANETGGGAQSEPARPKPARRVTRRTPAKAAAPAALETAPATEARPQDIGEAAPASPEAPIAARTPSEPAQTGESTTAQAPAAAPGETARDLTGAPALPQAAEAVTPDGADQQQAFQSFAAEASPQAPADFRSQTTQQRPAAPRPPFQNQQSRPAPGQRSGQPFSQRPAPPTSPSGQNDFNGQMDTQRGRRRRRRRGRGGLGNAPAAGPAPNGQITTPTPSAPIYEERGAPQDFASQRSAVVEAEGILDFLPNGEAFLRDEDLRERSEDLLIGVRDIRRFDLRNGDTVRLEARAGRGRGPVTVERVISINDIPFERMRNRMRFEDLTPIYPDRMIKLETGQFPLTTRILDLFAPVGFGQRALIVSPPKAGKTTMLKNIGTGVLANYPNASLIVCLVGERPEEVTDLRMSLPRAIMFASSFDEDVERHGHLAEMALERAKRLAEQGKDVVVLLDSITRLARAYNLGGSGGGRTLSGGMDASALTTARRIFGAARAIEQGGSLTIIATCLVDTGSRLDDVVYEEFKGTGNMELHLDRALAERRIFPAIDIGKSSTRKEELLLDPQTLQFVVALRRRLAGPQAMQATERLIESLGKTPSNRVFFDLLSRAQS